MKKLSQIITTAMMPSALLVSRHIAKPLAVMVGRPNRQ